MELNRHTFKYKMRMNFNIVKSRQKIKPFFFLLLFLILIPILTFVVKKAAQFYSRATGQGSMILSGQASVDISAPSFNVTVIASTGEIQSRGSDVRITFPTAQLQLINIVPLDQTMLKTFFPVNANYDFDKSAVITKANAGNGLEFTALPVVKSSAAGYPLPTYPAGTPTPAFVPANPTPANNYVAGSIQLATLTFKPLATGRAVIAFDFKTAPTPGWLNDTNIAGAVLNANSLEQDVLGSVTNLSITITKVTPTPTKAPPRTPTPTKKPPIPPCPSRYSCVSNQMCTHGYKSECINRCGLDRNCCRCVPEGSPTSTSAPTKTPTPTINVTPTLSYWYCRRYVSNALRLERCIFCPRKVYAVTSNCLASCRLITELIYYPDKTTCSSRCSNDQACVAAGCGTTGTCIRSATPTPTATPTLQACKDGDGGIVRETQGSTCVPNGSGGSFCRYDGCPDAAHLQEFYCKPDHTIGEQNLVCGSGRTCFSGACQYPPTNTPVPTGPIATPTPCPGGVCPVTRE